jgi:hypothetical protein
MMNRKFAFVAVSLLAVVGVICAISKAANEVPLKGKWPHQPFQPTAIFDGDFELSVKDGRIHIRCGDQLDGEVRRVSYDKASDVLTLEDIALEEGKKTPILHPRVQILVHPDRPHPGIRRTSS